MKRKARMLVPIVAALAPIVTALALVGLVTLVWVWWERRYIPNDAATVPFDREKWLAAWPRNRIGMARYLVDHKALNGMSRSALVEMLGEPDIKKPGDEGTRWYLGCYRKGLFDETVWLGVCTEAPGDGAVNSVDWDPPPPWAVRRPFFGF